MDEDLPLLYQFFINNKTISLPLTTNVLTSQLIRKFDDSPSIVKVRVYDVFGTYS